MKPVRALAAAALAACTVAATACGSGAGAPDDLTVYAAASLKPAFTKIGHVYEQQHPGAHVKFSFGGSNTLEQQLESGAQADVFASANDEVMHRAVSSGLTDGDPITFTKNILTIVTPPDNPAGISSFAELAEPGVSVVVCAPQVPCGDATVRAARATGVHLSPVSEENDVTDVLGKITAGQADAGLVYVTDAAYAGDTVHAVDFPAADDAVNTYPIAALGGADHPDAAHGFIGLVTRQEGQRILQEAGFR